MKTSTGKSTVHSLLNKNDFLSCYGKYYEGGIKHLRSVSFSAVKNPLKMLEIKVKHLHPVRIWYVHQTSWKIQLTTPRSPEKPSLLCRCQMQNRCWIEALLQFNSTASFFQLAFDFFGFRLVNTFFDGRRNAFDKFFGVHQALASDVLHFLDDVELLFSKTR